MGLRPIDNALERFSFNWRRKAHMLVMVIIIGFAMLTALFFRALPSEAFPEIWFLLAMLTLFALGAVYAVFFYIQTIFITPFLKFVRDYENQVYTGSPINIAEYQSTMIEGVVEAFLPKIDENQELGEPQQSSENWLAQVLHYIDQGVMVLNFDHRLLLINQKARRIFEQQNSVRLGQMLGELIDISPIEAALKRFEITQEQRGERIFCRILGSERIIPVRINLLRDQQGAIQGYVLGFHDRSDSLFQMRILERNFEQLLKRTSEVLTAQAFWQAQSRSSNTDKAQEKLLSSFKSELMDYRQLAHAQLGQAWPKARISLSAFLTLLKNTYEPLTIVERGLKATILVDAGAVVEALHKLFQSLEEDNVQDWLLIPVIEDEVVKFRLRSSLRHIPIAHIENAVNKPLLNLAGAPTGEDVLRAHKTEIWPHKEDDLSELVFLLPRIKDTVYLFEQRPEYYDFSPPKLTGSQSDSELDAQSFVVFDTETTGLDPRGGDRIVQISAVRVMNGKVIDSEIFDELVNPERTIPISSTKIHGISQDMVKHSETIDQVLPRFHKFCAGDPLIAHNAAFDMAFLKKSETAASVTFDQAVLDTVYMSAYLFDFTGKHTLDDLARRFQIEIPENMRHNALGDALATARIFVALLPLLKARGVHNLGQCLELVSHMGEIRKQQARYTD